MSTQSRLTVLLHADIVGSTGLVQSHERTAHDRMQATFQSLSAIVARYAGTTHELRGDALVAEFGKASDAISASLAFQAEHTPYVSALVDDIRPT